MVVRDACPACGSHREKKHGHTRHGKQHRQWTTCACQFAAPAEDRRMAGEQRTTMAPWRRERLARRGICRAGGVRLTGLFPCLVACLRAGPDACQVQRPPHPTDVVMPEGEAEADELWRGGQKQAHQPGSGMAMDAKTRPVMAFHVGNRRRDRAKELWATLPLVSRAQAPFPTDHYEAYPGVIPADRQTAITKQARKTNQIERCHPTLRQRVSRLVRETVSFSKQLANHIGAIWYFICH
jgi:insertion element IS1 protein InsB